MIAVEKLENSIRDYDWGSPTALAELLGHTPSGRPEAELWIGSHPAAPSRLLSDGRSLTDVLKERPEENLGAEVVASQPADCVSLPFLMKVLSADAPLSLQVHPDAQQAKAGFILEQSSGVPIDVPHRMYKDPRPKPEMILALTPFKALTGFRSAEQGIPAWEFLRGNTSREETRTVANTVIEHLNHRDYKSALAYLVTGVDGIDAVVADAVQIIERDAEAARTVDALLPLLPWLNQKYPGDSGVLVSLLLNYVELEPGEAVALQAGNLHAYLHGTAVEVMGNSDNVLRCGMTSKYINVDELMSIVRFASLEPTWVRPQQEKTGIELYSTEFDVFELVRINGASSGDISLRGPACIIALAGNVTVRGADGTQVQLGRGESAFIPASAGGLSIEADEDAHAYLCATPLNRQKVAASGSSPR
nr:mannose-6-phosphate isomerase, class I [Pseudoglutamicibacter albus]